MNGTARRDLYATACQTAACLCTATVLSLLAGFSAAGETNATPALANELAMEGNHEASAIEYRRLTLTEPRQEQRAGYYWAAAYEYVRASHHDLASKMLDRVDENSQKLAIPSLLLRGESALLSGKQEEAAFYYRSVLKAKPDDPADTNQAAFLLNSKTAAARYLAHALATSGDTAQARGSLAEGPADNSAAIAALDNYAQGHDKTPWVGGLLGLVPGLGYAYSGEYANGLRSLILNGLFIYAMADTGHDEEWGAFAAVTFFEITWYTGSIYGGVDAAHRYNRIRLDECLKTLDRDSGFSPDLRQIPLVSLRFEF